MADDGVVDLAVVDACRKSMLVDRLDRRCVEEGDLVVVVVRDEDFEGEEDDRGIAVGVDDSIIATTTTTISVVITAPTRPRSGECLHSHRFVGEVGEEDFIMVLLEIYPFLPDEEEDHRHPTITATTCLHRIVEEVAEEDHHS